MAELHAVPQLAGQACESPGEPLVVAAESRRQLPEERAELGRTEQWLDALEEALEPGPHVPQTLDMCEIARRLDREEEVAGCPFDPVRDRVAARQPVEGRVHLHRVEALRVELEPARCGQPWRVEDAVAPVRVVPAGEPYSDKARA